MYLRFLPTIYTTKNEFLDHQEQSAITKTAKWKKFLGHDSLRVV